MLRLIVSLTGEFLDRYCSAVGKGAVTVEQLPVPVLGPIKETVCEGDQYALAVKGTPPFRVHVTSASNLRDIILTEKVTIPSSCPRLQHVLQKEALCETALSTVIDCAEHVRFRFC